MILARKAFFIMYFIFVLHITLIMFAWYMATHLGNRVLHDEYICDCAKHAEVFLQLLRRCLPAETTNKQLPWCRITTTWG